jgi:hypothetical protein
MKKTTTLSMLLFIATLSFAQSNVNFSVTKYGTYEVPFSSNDYYVITFPNQTQTQLYTSALKAITRDFVSAKDVVSKVENEMISVNAIHRFTESYSAFSLTYDVNYTFEMEFRDGRVRINAPNIVRITDQYGDRVSFTECATSSTTGELLESSRREFSFVNNVINRILSNMNSRYSDDW